MKANHQAKWSLLSMPFVLWVGWQGLEQYDYATSDAISRSAIDTRRILRRFGSSGDSREIRRWISDGPTEAPGAQMCLTLSEWAVNHQNEFESIVEALPATQRAKFVDVFCASLNQGGEKTFGTAFKNIQSPAMAQILRTLSDGKSLPR